jgi:sirohydrochlorin cobaltochelatase
MTSTTLILFAHGSGDPRWRQPFERLEAEVARRVGGDRVRLAYMEFARPTLDEVAAEAARRGVLRLRLLPLFLSAGGHVATDVPALVADVIHRHPQLQIEVLPPAGEDPRLMALLEDIAEEAAG